MAVRLDLGGAEAIRLTEHAERNRAHCDAVEFHLGYGDWIRLLRESGFEIEDLIEIQAPEGAEQPRFVDVTYEWARQWPSEEIWKARKRA